MSHDGYERNGKIIKISTYADEGETKLLWLSDRQRQLLNQIAPYLYWQNRYNSIPENMLSSGKVTDYIDVIRDRLMEVVEFCAEMIKCLDDDEDVKNKITQIINNAIGNGTDNVPGEEMKPDEFEREIAPGSNPTCDSVKLARQCSYVVRFFDKGITDFLQRITVSVNTIELAQQIAELPFVNLITRNVGIQSALDFVVYMSEAIKEQYEAGQSDEYMDELARKLYCLCQDDCKITLDRYFQMTAENINELIPTTITEGISTLVDILEVFTGLDTVGTDTVDLLYWLTGISAKVLSFISFKVADRALDFGLTSAANDASYDLDISELECPPECMFVVEANIDPSVSPFGQDSGIAVVSGSTYNITASGTWNYGTTEVTAEGEVGTLNPAAIAPDEYIGCLLVKIGESGTWSGLTPEIIFGADDNGTLYFAMNDVPGAYTDNSGTLCVIVTLIE